MQLYIVTKFQQTTIRINGSMRETTREKESEDSGWKRAIGKVADLFALIRSGHIILPTAFPFNESSHSSNFLLCSSKQYIPR